MADDTVNHDIRSRPKIPPAGRDASPLKTPSDSVEFKAATTFKQAKDSAPAGDSLQHNQHKEEHHKSLSTEITEDTRMAHDMQDIKNHDVLEGPIKEVLLPELTATNMPVCTVGRLISLDRGSGEGLIEYKGASLALRFHDPETMQALKEGSFIRVVGIPEKVEDTLKLDVKLVSILENFDEELYEQLVRTHENLMRMLK